MLKPNKFDKKRLVAIGSVFALLIAICFLLAPGFYEGDKMYPLYTIVFGGELYDGSIYFHINISLFIAFNMAIISAIILLLEKGSKRGVIIAIVLNTIVFVLLILSRFFLDLHNPHLILDHFKVGYGLICCIAFVGLSIFSNVVHLICLIKRILV